MPCVSVIFGGFLTLSVLLTIALVLCLPLCECTSYGSSVFVVICFHSDYVAVKYTETDFSKDNVLI